jgi:folylpolyglutamate synthase/dihydropteroate synthase
LTNSRDALASALDNAKPSDIILVTGSIFLSGELRPQLLKKLRK